EAVEIGYHDSMNFELDTGVRTVLHAADEHLLQRAIHARLIDEGKSLELDAVADVYKLDSLKYKTGPGELDGVYARADCRELRKPFRGRDGPVQSCQHRDLSTPGVDGEVLTRHESCDKNTSDGS